MVSAIFSTRKISSSPYCRPALVRAKFRCSFCSSLSTTLICFTSSSGLISGAPPRPPAPALDWLAVCFLTSRFLRIRLALAFSALTAPARSARTKRSQTAEPPNVWIKWRENRSNFDASRLAPRKRQQAARSPKKAKLSPGFKNPGLSAQHPPRCLRSFRVP